MTQLLTGSARGFSRGNLYDRNGTLVASSARYAVSITPAFKAMIPGTSGAPDI